MTDIITLGELLIDLTQKGVDENGYGKFTAFPGGAPANVAAAASRLGASTGFIGKIGNDIFGNNLLKTLEEENIDTSGLYVSLYVPTTLAIVAVDDEGERNFSFYRNPGADTQITADEAIKALTELPRILHVGSLSLTTSPSREACTEAVNYARKNGVLISYDPNYREALWDTEAHAIEEMKSLLPSADILKVSDEEMRMLTGTNDLEEGSKILAGYGIKLILITLGADGVFVRFGENCVKVPGFKVKVADTNGAGDTFLGAVLSRIVEFIKNGGALEDIEFSEIEKYVIFANKAASLTCSRSGAIPAMPYAEELKDYE